MTARPTSCPPFRPVRSSVLLGAATAVAMVILVASAPAQLSVALACGAAAGVIALAAQLPARLLSPHASEGAAMGFVLGTLIRLTATVFAAWFISRALAADAVVVAAWTVGWYLWLLAVEVAVLIRYLSTRRIAGPPVSVEGGRAC